MKLESGDGNVASTNAKAGSEITPAFVIKKNRFDEVWAYVQPYGRYELAHLRIFTVSEDDGMIPTKRGTQSTSKTCRNSQKPLRHWFRRWRDRRSDDEQQRWGRGRVKAIPTQARLNRLLRAVEVAEFLSVPTSWVYAEARAGRMPHITVGRYRRFSLDSIEAWAKSRERGPKT